MSDVIVIRGQLCSTWNGGRMDENQLGLLLPDGNVAILAQLIREKLGHDYLSAKVIYGVSPEPIVKGSNVYLLRMQGIFHAYYKEHRQEAHGYQATEDYEPEEYIGTTEEISFSCGNIRVDFIQTLLPLCGQHFFMVLEPLE